MTLLTRLERLVKVKTVSTNREICLNALKNIQSEIPNSIIDDETLLMHWGHTDLASAEWLVNTHLDVVPGVSKQFALKISGDKVRGRGTADVKGCVAVITENANNWAQFAIKNKVTFMLVSDEEIGGQSTKDILVNMSNLKGAIFLEPSGLHLTTMAKGMMQIKIVASGINSHGSRPWEGQNAIEKLCFGLTQFRLMNQSPNQETRNTTFNFSQIKGGMAINQVPSSAELWCDVRFNPQDNPTTISQILAKAFSGCTITVNKCESPIKCDQKSPLFKQLSASLKANSINPLAQFDHGTSDARHATALGIPAIVFGPKGGNLHAQDEWVSLKSLLKVQNVLDHWIKNI
jgi:succinyl-diaminopimelate desuccinylase